MIKIGNTSFNEEVIRKMSLKEFKDQYSKILKGQDLEKVYNKLTPKETTKLSLKDKEVDGPKPKG